MLSYSETQILGLACLIGALAGAQALAQGPAGNTANGCTYAVINGNYTYSCEPQAAQAASPKTPTMVEQTQAKMAPAPAAAEPAPVLQISSEPPRNQGQVVRNDDPAATTRTSVVRTTEDPSLPLHDPLYIGTSIGSFQVTESKSGAATGLGFSVSQNLDEFVGFDLGYSYAKNNLRLGLANRGGGSTSTNQSDATLANHLVTGEVQFHLSDTHKRLRPYAGLGLGWKNSSLDEDLPSFQQSGGSLSQSSLGLVGSLGAKVRVADRYQIAAGLRYFRPISSQDATLSSGSANGFTTPSTRLTATDATLTASSVVLIFGGLSIAL